jgi:peptidyl-prolyl cis-trans isomerase C
LAACSGLNRAAGHGLVNARAAADHCKAKSVGRQVRQQPPAKRAFPFKDSVMTTALFAGISAPARRAAYLIACLAAVSALLIVSAAPLRAQDKDPVVAKVNGVEIHQSDLAVAEEEAGQLPPMSPAAKKDYLVQFMADMILVSKAAEAKKMGDGADFKRKLDFARNKLLMEALLQSTAKAAMTDAAMHKVYDDATKTMTHEEEVHARHILIRAPAGDEKASKAAEEKIKAVIVRLKKGEDFAKVASEVTEDPSGKANGGDLGYFTKEQMVPEFANVAFKLNKGQISDPVKTQFGWHVLKVEDKRAKPVPKFEEVKPQIEQYVTRKAQADLVTSLRASAKIEKMYKTEAPAKPDEPPKK